MIGSHRIHIRNVAFADHFTQNLFYIQDGHQLAVRAHQLHAGVRRLLEDALVFLARFCFHNDRAVARRDHRRRHQQCVHEIAASELVTHREEIRPGLAGGAIERMAFRAGELLFIREQPGSARDITVVSQRVLAISIQARTPDGRLGHAWKFGAPDTSERQ